MSLYGKLLQRAVDGKPIRVGIIGAGKFGSMYLSQVVKTPGIHLVAIADRSIPAAKQNLARVGWSDERLQANSIDEAILHGSTYLSENWLMLVSDPRVDVVVECTGNPIAAMDHILAAFEHGKHVVNVTVEADAMCAIFGATRA